MCVVFRKNTNGLRNSPHQFQEPKSSISRNTRLSLSWREKLFRYRKNSSITPSWLQNLNVRSAKKFNRLAKIRMASLAPKSFSDIGKAFSSNMVFSAHRHIRVRINRRISSITGRKFCKASQNRQCNRVSAGKRHRRGKFLPISEETGSSNLTAKISSSLRNCTGCHFSHECCERI